jgi:hypothetical protein
MLPPADAYGWRFLICHLRGAGKDDDADRLLINYAWIKAKLRASGAQGLFDSYLPESQDEGGRLVGRAIALSLPAFAAHPHELSRQFFGRLGGLAHEAVAGIVASAQQDPDFRPAPRWPGLTPPGAERLRLFGHQSSVQSAAFSPDGPASSPPPMTTRRAFGTRQPARRSSRCTAITGWWKVRPSPSTGRTWSPPPKTTRRACGTRQPARRSHE